MLHAIGATRFKLTIWKVLTPTMNPVVTPFARLWIASAAITIPLALIGLAHPAAGQCLPPNPQPPSVPLAQLQAGQYNVGLAGVIEFAQPALRTRWGSGGEAGRIAVDSYLKARPMPVVVGPDAQLHLTDNHHRAMAVQTLREEFGAPFPDYVYYYVIADLSAYSGAAFWDKLLEGGVVLDANDCAPVSDLRHQFLWPYDRGVQQDPNINPPPMIPGLRDDILRSISANARSANGYADFENYATTPPFVFFYIEFYWANFLRDRVFLQGAGWELRGGNPKAEFVFTVLEGETEADAVRRLLAVGAPLCRDPGAATLPGWACPADVNANGVVDAEDLGLVLGTWGSAAADRYDTPTVDINRDGFVDGGDLGAIFGAWGNCGTP